MSKLSTILSLGDSYTIAESELLTNSYPYQTVGLFRKKGSAFCAPEIVARTGWTTHDLLQAMGSYPFLPSYNFVTILIGVNNQFQGRSIEEYALELESILKAAIGLVDKPEQVVIISIPDYSTTPFGATLNPEKIAREIDVFNSSNKALAVQYRTSYLDITTHLRQQSGNPDWLANDELHLSAKAYANWAENLSVCLGSQIK